MSREERGRGVRSLGDSSSLVQGSLCVLLMVSFEITRLNYVKKRSLFFILCGSKKKKDFFFLFEKRDCACACEGGEGQRATGGA